MPGSASSMRMMPEIAPPIDAREDREDQVERADVLVVGRHEPAGEEARLVVGIVMRVIVVVGVEAFSGGGHVSVSIYR